MEPNHETSNDSHENLQKSTEIITIEGRNLGEVETKYFGDLKHIRKNIYNPDINSEESFYHLSEEQNQIINTIEKRIEEIKTKTKIQPLDIDQNGKVLLKEGQFLHSITNVADGQLDHSARISSIANLGILASEWFGILENESEGRFCSFFSTIIYNKDDLISRFDESNSRESISFTIDHSNPQLQNLLRLDFFKYCGLKTENPELLNDVYTNEELAILEFIEQLSPAGTDMYKFRPNWKAIPGGIPAHYINGIKIDGKLTRHFSEDGSMTLHYAERPQEDIDKLHELFPNATIFNRNLDVLSKPTRQ